MCVDRRRWSAATRNSALPLKTLPLLSTSTVLVQVAYGSTKSGLHKLNHTVLMSYNLTH